MTGAVIAAVIAVIVAGYWVARLWRFLSRQWFLRVAVQFLSGWRKDEPPGRGRRAARRCGGTAAAVVLLAAWMVSPQVTGRAVLGLAAAAAVLGGWWVWRWVWQFRHRRTWLRPTHLATHDIAQVDRRRPPQEWITATVDSAGAVRKAVFELPPGWPAEAQDERRLVAAASAKLGIEGPKVEWRRAGPAPLLTLTHSPPPPGHVKLADVLDEMARCGPDELLIGVGKDGAIVRASLATDSPHIAISMGTGAGKSNLAGFLLLQMLIRGGIGQVLDAKRRLSYPWLLKDMDRNVVQLPNVAYACTAAQIHASMEWLGTDELDRRGDVAFAGMDTRGKVHANVGARLFTIAEELNLAVPRLKEFWVENRTSDDPVKSPAFTGLAGGAFAGRQVYMHLVLLGQMLTAEVTGSKDSSVREQCGITLMARYRERGWRLMCGDVPMPSPPTELGRVQVVTAGGTRVAQVPEIDPEMARQMVLDGIISPLPHNMPCQPARPRQPVTVTGAPMLNGASDLRAETAPVTPPRGPVGLKAAVDEGLLHPGTTLGALRMARHRKNFPPRAGKRGSEYLYDPVELAAWDVGRR